MNTRQTKRIRRNVGDGTAFKRHGAARRHIQEIHEDLDRLAQRMSELRRQFGRWRERLTGEMSPAEELPSQDVTMHLRARRLLVASVLVLVLEMGLAGFIASSWLNFSKPVAALVGALLAAILAAIADVLMGLMEDPENPRTSEARIKAWARWLTVSCLAVLTVICLTRFFDIGTIVFPWASGALTILLPATAGSYLTLRSLFETGNRIADVWTSLDDEVRQTRILRDEVEAQLEELRARVAVDGGNEPPAEPGSDRGQGGPRAATWLVLALLLPALMSFLAQSASAQPWNGEVIQVRVDVSGSLDTEESRNTVTRMKSTLAKLIRQPGSRVRRVDLYAWATAKDSVRGPIHTFSIPAPIVVRCAPPRLSEAERILKMASEAKTRQAERECAARRQRARASYEQSLSLTLGRLGASLDGILNRQSGASQTCFFQVLHEVADTPARNLVLLLTDAEHSNCGMPPSPAARPKGQVYVVLVPGQGYGDDALQRREERTRQIRGFLPTTRVVPSNKLDGSLGWLAAER